jgi:hypothetical protein
LRSFHRSAADLRVAFHDTLVRVEREGLTLDIAPADYRGLIEACVPSPPAAAGERSSIDRELSDLLESRGRRDVSQTRRISVPLHLGDYVVKRRVGSGGFGIVFEALEVGTGERVAIKILRAPLTSALEGFKNEARQLTDWWHSAWVVPDEMIAVDGTLALVMPFVAGRPFTEALAHAAGERGALADETRCRALSADLIQAVDALHEHGLLHLDLKPANVIVTLEDEVRVLDFGLARRLSTAGLVEDDEFAGTPSYMAPEQLTGAARSAATDLYSVGLMVYEALGGSPAFAPGTRRLMDRVSHQPPRLDTLRPGVERAFSDLCQSLLATRPRDRPTSQEVIATLAPKRIRRHEAGRMPLLGRRREREALDDLWTTAGQGVAAMVLISGPPGIGKTALVEHFATAVVRDGALSIWGRCFACESLRYKALDAAIDQLAGLLRARPAAAAAVAQLSEVAALCHAFPAFRPLVGDVDIGESPPPNAPERIRAAIRAVVAILAEEAPILLVIEDAHWGDADSVDLLTAILQPPSAPRVLVAVTHRDAEWRDAPFARALEARVRRGLPFAIARVELGRLEDEHALALASRRLGSEAGEAQAVALVEAAGGNPFVLAELLAHPASAAPDADVASAVSSRLDAWPEAVQRFVRCVAVAGSPLPVMVLARAAGVPPPSRAILGQLRAQAVLRPVLLGPVRAVDCYHDLVRQALTQAMLEPDRRELHCAIAREIVAGEADAGVVAHHFVAGGLLAEGRAWALRGATLAEQHGAHAQAAELLGLARRAGADDREVRLRWANALREAGRGREAANAFLEVARFTRDATDRRRCRRLAAESLLDSGAVTDGMAIMNPLLAELGVAASGHPLPRGLRIAAGALWIARNTELTPASPDAAEAERFDACWAMAKSLLFADPIAGIDALLRALRHAVASGDVQRIARASGPLAAFVLAQLPGYKRAAGRWIDALRERRDDPYFVGIHALWRALESATHGRLDEVIRFAREAVDRLGTVADATWERVQAVLFMERGLMCRGHYATLLAFASAHVIDAERRGDLYAAVTMSTGTMLPRVAFGLIAETRAVADWISAAWLPDRYSPQRFYAVLGHVMADLYEGRPDDAARRIVAGRRDFERAGGYRFPFSRLDHDLLEARVAAALGPRGADGLLSLPALLARLRAIPMPEGRAHAELLRASHENARGQREQALVALDLAVDGFTRAHVDLEGAVARLRRAELRGDRQEADSAAAAIRQLGVRDPLQWANTVAPGFDAMPHSRPRVRKPVS